MTPAPSLPRASSAPSRATHPSEEKVSRWSGVLPTPPPPRPSLRPSLPQRSLLSQSAAAIAQAHPAKMTSSLRLLRSFITRATHALVVHLNSMPSSSRLPRGLLLTLLLIAGARAEEESCSHTQLTTLSREHKSAPWVRFTDESDPLQAWAKQPTEDSSVAVLKVTVLSSAPLRLVTDLFTSQDPEIISRWNAYTGDVVQLGGHTQVQTYKLPWPFLQREYIVKCESIVLPRDQGHQTHCVPQHEHKEVPFLHDRVRGASETLWSFTSERGKDGRLYTRITFEGIVDPRGRLPKWIVNEIGKRTSITIVGSLGHLAVCSSPRAPRSTISPHLLTGWLYVRILLGRLPQSPKASPSSLP